MRRLPVNPSAYATELQRLMSIEAAKQSAKRQELEQRKKESLQASLAGMVNNGWTTVYTNQVPYELDVLRTNLYEKVDIGWLIQTVLGTGLSNPLFLSQFPCTPVSPPGLSVDVGPGVIYNFTSLLASDYSVIPADVNPDHRIYKTYVSFDTVNLATPAPLVPGNSVVHLVQSAQETQNVNVVNRPYFNSADPSSPIYDTQSDTMQDLTVVAIKLGIEAPSPTPPTPDPGYTALYYIAVAYGQTSIVSGDITVVPGAPFITESLTQKISAADVNSSFVTKTQQQQSTNIYAPDIGTANSIVANPSPSYGAYVTGTTISILVANTNTGSSTLNINSIGATNIQMPSPTGLRNLLARELQAGAVHQFIFNGSVFILLNPAGGGAQSDLSILTFNPTTQQTLTGTPALILFDNTIIDSATVVTSNGFTPYAGWWEFSFSLSATSTGIGHVYLYKNGSEFFRWFFSSVACAPGIKSDLTSGSDLYQLFAEGSATLGNGINSNRYVDFEAKFIRST